MVIEIALEIYTDLAERWPKPVPKGLLESLNINFEFLKVMPTNLNTILF